MLRPRALLVGGLQSSSAVSCVPYSQFVARGRPADLCVVFVVNAPGVELKEELGKGNREKRLVIIRV